MSTKKFFLDANDIIKRYYALEPISKIAQSYGCSHNTITRFLAKNGIKGCFPCDRLPHTEIITAYLSGESENALAKRFKTSRVVIRRILNLNSIQIRDNATANRVMMAKRTTAENLRNTQAAHMATRGKPQPESLIYRIAIGKERTLPNVSHAERIVADGLQEAGINIIPQKAVGKYNIDIAIPEFSIAVEIFGGKWHLYGNHARRFRERFDYIINAGWLPIIIWDNSTFGPDRMAGAIKYIVTLVKRMGSGETIIRQEHVISCYGEPCSTGKDKLIYRAAIGGDKGGNPIRCNNPSIRQ